MKFEIKLPFPDGEMTVIYGIDEKRKIPVWTEQSICNAIKDASTGWMKEVSNQLRKIEALKASLEQLLSVGAAIVSDEEIEINKRYREEARRLLEIMKRN